MRLTPIGKALIEDIKASAGRSVVEAAAIHAYLYPWSTTGRIRQLANQVPVAAQKLGLLR